SGGGEENSVSKQSSYIILDRMYIHGSTTDGTSRCVAMNGYYQAVIDSWLTECHAKGGDAQGVGGWGGGGPFLIENNRIEASGQHIMFGGADPAINGVSPSDITIRRNYLYKPTSWSGGKWSVKATFELKHAKRVLFEQNVLENHWADAQVGFPILFQTVSQYNQAPWTTIQDITVRNNLIKNATAGVNILSRMNTVPTVGTRRVLVENNLFQDVGKDPINGQDGQVFQLLSDNEDITFVNNTATISTRTAKVLYFDGNASVRTTFVNNVLPMSNYGVGGTGFGSGTATLNRYAPGGVFVGNVIPNATAKDYPADNFFPSTATLISFLSDFSLSGTSPYVTGKLGKVGVNGATLATALQGVVQ
ncbi:MAG: hypothetical protein ACO1Q7_15070, partial [Gemmatimonas sp.]